MLRPGDASLRCDLAVLLQLSGGDGDAAAEEYRRTVQLDPSHRTAWYNLGCLYNTLDREAEAVPCFERSLALQPNHAPSHHNLGQSLFNLGETDAAIECYRHALALGAGRLAETTLAMSIAIAPAASPRDVLRVRRDWAKHQLPGPIFARHESAVESDPRRPLRVGYFSAFFDHPNWMKPVWALVNRHDRERIGVYLYSDGQQTSPPQGYRPADGDQLRHTAKLSNVELAKLVHADRLDVLVDLNGFSRVPRLAVAALRPAPCIVGWFNMFATTGMSAFDYLIADERVVAPGEESDYCERIVRVRGCYLTFEVTYPVPEIAASKLSPLGSGPGEANAPFTFGSLASLYKITSPVLDLWATILSRCPDSQLLLRNKGLAAKGNREWILRRLAERGIAADRVQLEGPTDHFEFLRTYERIDLALDTFPYNGGTTTTEALWQGVPVVAIHGDRWTSRVSSSLLSNAGLTEFVAHDADEYVEIAVAAATTDAGRQRLADLRPKMRDHLRTSQVCACDEFARSMEEIYQRLRQSRETGVESRE